MAKNLKTRGRLVWLPVTDLRLMRVNGTTRSNAGAGGSRRSNRAASRAMMPDRFFDRRLEWSQYKHEILSKYLRIWVYKLSSANDSLAFVDACAGEGRYGDGSPGSPLIAAQWNDTYLADKGKRLVVFACEQNRIAGRSLEEVLRPWTSAVPPLAHVYRRRFSKVMPEIMALTRSTPTIFFIDPYGMKGFSLDQLHPLLTDRDRAPTEVLVRADPTLLARFAGWLRGGTGDRPRHPAAGKFRELLQRLNIDTEDLEERIEDDPEYSPDRMVLFASYLQVFRDRFNYVQVIPIRPSSEAAPKYFLVHGTDSEHGMAFMNDAASTTEDTLYENTVEAENRLIGQRSLFDDVAQMRPRRYRLEDVRNVVLEVLRDGDTHRFIQVRAILAERLGPDFRERHHKGVVRELVQQGLVEQLQPGALKDGSWIRLRPRTATR